MKTLIAKFIGLYLNVLAIFSRTTAGKKGYYIFSSPARKAVKDHQLGFLETAEKSSFQCNGDTIRVYRWGTGDKKILLLHGWQSNSFRWKYYIDGLAKDQYTVYALDAPGHGLSTGKYLNIAIYSEVIETFLYLTQPMDAIVGHSMGAVSVLYTLYRLPNLDVKKLVIMGCPGEANDYMIRFTKILSLNKTTLQAIVDGFERFTYHVPTYFSSPRFGEAVKIPTLIIHDREDSEAPYHHIPGIHQAIKNSQLVTTSGLGHNLRSPEIVKQVLDFVQVDVSEKAIQVVKLHLN